LVPLCNVDCLPLGLAAIKLWSREKFNGADALKLKINPTQDSAAVMHAPMIGHHEIPSFWKPRRDCRISSWVSLPEFNVSVLTSPLASAGQAR
jgi:hypothetical protein